MYQGAADLLYFCTILHFRYININIYTINFVDLFMWFIEMKKKRRSSLCFVSVGRHTSIFWFLAAVFFFFFSALTEAVCYVTFLLEPPAAFNVSVTFTARSASQCQSSRLYVKKTRLDIVVWALALR